MPQAQQDDAPDGRLRRPQVVATVLDRGVGCSVMTEEHVKKSRFLSWALRHAPDKIGLRLDTQGWADVADLIDCARSAGIALPEAVIQEIVETEDKGRYSMSPDRRRIRASYGHSVDIDLGLRSEMPPSSLYHGTATRFLDLVMARGLTPGRRRFVHLSTNTHIAGKVGSRHGKPVILEIDAEAMHGEGFEFYRTAAAIWLVRNVPSGFIRVVGFGSDDDETTV
jgi:putative RNA 2'-phosphotransferase